MRFRATRPGTQPYDIPPGGTIQTFFPGPRKTDPGAIGVRRTGDSPLEPEGPCRALFRNPHHYLWLIGGRLPKNHCGPEKSGCRAYTPGGIVSDGRDRSTAVAFPNSSAEEQTRDPTEPGPDIAPIVAARDHGPARGSPRPGLPHLLHDRSRHGLRGNARGGERRGVLRRRPDNGGHDRQGLPRQCRTLPVRGRNDRASLDGSSSTGPVSGRRSLSGAPAGR